ncbi:hypothetical protein QAD02_008662 [Eretmocerus hayati]|uniref:Uncharacterized protein n=1 Tax=Eretmocerus hayati TaxID=131215 RepID=A0ACC2N722_9HYME|nr:hypothetical protein QAD02_008662 [Eretmocerus hayati]
MSFVSLFHIFGLVLFLFVAAGSSEGVFEKIRAGLQNAKNYLETAKNIADLVSNSLNKNKYQSYKMRGDNDDFADSPRKDTFEPKNLISSFFRLMGLDSGKVTAITVNGFVFLAQLISELFKLKPKMEQSISESYNLDTSDIAKVVTGNENEKVQNLWNQAQSKSLPRRLIEEIGGRNSSCVQLLICKSSPIIWAAQKSMRDQSVRIQRDITSWLPSREKFEEYSDNCDDKYRDCRMNFT